MPASPDSGVDGLDLNFVAGPGWDDIDELIDCDVTRRMSQYCFPDMEGLISNQDVVTMAEPMEPMEVFGCPAEPGQNAWQDDLLALVVAEEQPTFTLHIHPPSEAEAEAGSFEYMQVECGPIQSDGAPILEQFNNLDLHEASEAQPLDASMELEVAGQSDMDVSVNGQSAREDSVMTDTRPAPAAGSTLLSGLAKAQDLTKRAEHMEGIELQDDVGNDADEESNAEEGVFSCLGHPAEPCRGVTVNGSQMTDIITGFLDMCPEHVVHFSAGGAMPCPTTGKRRRVRWADEPLVSGGDAASDSELEAKRKRRRI